jgi:hypothetical protein
VLSALKNHTSHLGITANAPNAFERAAKAGWEKSSASAALETGLNPLVAAVLEADGFLRLYAGSKAAIFSPVRIPTWHESILLDEEEDHSGQFLVF